MGWIRKNASGWWAAAAGVAAIASAAPVGAHQRHSHHPARPRKEQQTMPVPSSAQNALGEIGQEYQAKVQPIFQTKCLQYHGGKPDLPWYYGIPGIKQLIDRDLSESKHHRDFSKGYPFVSHATPIEDLEAIRNSVRDETMPPFIYLLMHWGHRLSESEKQTVIAWAESGIRKLKESEQPDARGEK